MSKSDYSKGIQTGQKGIITPLAQLQIQWPTAEACRKGAMERERAPPILFHIVFQHALFQLETPEVYALAVTDSRLQAPQRITYTILSNPWNQSWFDINL